MIRTLPTERGPWSHCQQWCWADRSRWGSILAWDQIRLHGRLTVAVREKRNFHIGYTELLSVMQPNFLWSLLYFSSYYSAQTSLVLVVFLLLLFFAIRDARILSFLHKKRIRYVGAPPGCNETWVNIQCKRPHTRSNFENSILIIWSVHWLQLEPLVVATEIVVYSGVGSNTWRLYEKMSDVLCIVACMLCRAVSTVDRKIQRLTVEVFKIAPSLWFVLHIFSWKLGRALFNPYERVSFWNIFIVRSKIIDDLHNLVVHSPSSKLFKFIKTGVRRIVKSASETLTQENGMGSLMLVGPSQTPVMPLWRSAQ
jgi:hypothetical protein